MCTNGLPSNSDEVFAPYSCLARSEVEIEENQPVAIAAIGITDYVFPVCIDIDFYAI